MFVKASKAISPQFTLDERFEQGVLIDEVARVYQAIEPDYSPLIPTSLLRRMGKAVRMGIGAGLPLLHEYGKVDGIILGTANGGLEDCVKFLNQIVDYNEGVLTPTNFVQSTPNAVAGQLALMTSTTAYNCTHVNGSLAFENSLLDAALQLEDNPSAVILVGAIEEFSQYNYTIDRLSGRYKDNPVSNSQLISDMSPGSICGEGCSMFILSNDATEATLEVIDVHQVIANETGSVKNALIELLQRNAIHSNEINTLLLGRNGDPRTQQFYAAVSDLFEEVKSVVHFKSYCGEYRTASAFGMYLAHKMTKQPISDWKGETLSFFGDFALIYNHFDGIRHGFILVKKHA